MNMPAAPDQESESEPGPESEPAAASQPDHQANTAIKVALIGAAATVMVAVVSGVFALLQSTLNRPAPSSPTIIVTAVATAVAPTAAPPTAAPLTAAPSVEIVGPTEAVVGDVTYFTIVSEDAERAEWSIGGFANNETFEVDPLPPSHQIFIEPTNAGRAGDMFTLVVTVYGKTGEKATARHEFAIVDADQ
jgi:hypothetical protein